MDEGIISITAAETLPPLPGIYRWGIELIQAIQAIQSPPLTALVKVITAMGTEAFYISVILLLFWCVDEKKGLRLGLLVILSGFVSGFFKVLFKHPRPYNLEPSAGLASETTYGFPSAHAQISLCFWLPCASWFGLYLRSKGKDKGMTVRIAAICIILVIGFTRLYLGVHFPTDLLGGWFLGALILGAYYKFSEPLAELLNRAGIRGRIIVIATVALGMNALLPSERSLGALFLGFGAGYNLMLKYCPFSARSGWDGSAQSVLKRLGRYILGLAGTALIYQTLRLILPGEASLFSGLSYWGMGSPYYELGRFIRYGLIGLWAAIGAPWLFLHLSLAESREP
jgi:membrane-associated phospholipid phosphatase